MVYEGERGREQSGHWHLKRDTASGLESAQNIFKRIIIINMGSLGDPVLKALPVNAGVARDVGSIPGWGR